MKKRIGILLLLLVFVTTGCTHSAKNNHTIEPFKKNSVLPPNEQVELVENITSIPLSAIREFNSELNQISLHISDDAKALTNGNIICLPANRIHRSGYIYKISERIEVESDDIIFQLEEPTIDEFLKYADISSEIPINTNNITIMTEEDEQSLGLTTLANNISETDFNFLSNNLHSTQTTQINDTGVGVKLTPLNDGFEVEFSKDNNKIVLKAKNPTLNTDIKYNLINGFEKLECVADFEFEQTIEWEYSQKNKPQFIKLCSFAVSTPIPGVDAIVSLGISITAEAKFNIIIGIKETITSGVKCVNGKTTPNSNLKIDSSPSKLELDGEAKLGLRLNVSPYLLGAELVCLYADGGIGFKPKFTNDILHETFEKFRYLDLGLDVGNTVSKFLPQEKFGLKLSLLNEKNAKFEKIGCFRLNPIDVHWDCPHNMDSISENTSSKGYEQLIEKLTTGYWAGGGVTLGTITRYKFLKNGTYELETYSSAENGESPQKNKYSLTDTGLLTIYYNNGTETYQYDNSESNFVTTNPHNTIAMKGDELDSLTQVNESLVDSIKKSQN